MANNKRETPEEREKRLVSLAMALAEKQLIEGTAPPSVVAHFLRKADVEDIEIEREIKRNQAELLRSKSENIQKTETDASIMKEAADAFKSYKGEKKDV